MKFIKLDFCDTFRRIKDLVKLLFSTALFLLVIAVSLDGFTVGVTYGMKHVKIPFAAIFIIMFCSGLVVITSMSIGHLLSLFISEKVTNILGGLIFIFLGIVVLISLIRTSSTKPKNDTNNEEQHFNNIKTVLKSPEKADLDKSGSISLSEALLLGIALALDAFGAGIGAALLGFSPLLTTVLIALMSGLFLFTGCQIGLQLSRFKLFQKLTFTPPFILISLGIYNML